MSCQKDTNSQCAVSVPPRPLESPKRPRMAEGRQRDRKGMAEGRQRDGTVAEVLIAPSRPLRYRRKMSGESKKRWGAARVVVLAMRSTIEQELDAGLTVRAIYERHKAEIPVSLDRFRAYVGREITGTAGSRGGYVPNPLPGRPAKKSKATQPSLDTAGQQPDRQHEADQEGHAAAPEPPAGKARYGNPLWRTRSELNPERADKPPVYGDLKNDLDALFGPPPKKAKE